MAGMHTASQANTAISLAVTFFWAGQAREQENSEHALA